MVWYSHLLKNFPQFIVIHTVKAFDIVNKPEIAAVGQSKRNLKSEFDQNLDCDDNSKSIDESSASETDRNTSPPDLPLEKSVCRSRSNS